MIVMDTHAWIWFISNPELLSQTARDALEAAKSENNLVVSSISAWELALLVKKKTNTAYNGCRGLDSEIGSPFFY